MRPDQLRRALETACDGLVFSSESDRPFAYFRSDSPIGDGHLTIEVIRRLLGVSDATPIRERTLERFFAHHTFATDPYDTRAQAIRPRYEALVLLLERELQDVRAYVAGTIELACYIVGIDADGHLTGLQTTAIET